MNELITLDNAKEFQSLEPRGGMEKQLTAIVDGVNAAAPIHCGRQLIAGALTEWYDGNDRGILRLKQYPVIPETGTPVTPSVTYYDLSEVATAIASTDYWIDENAGILELKPNAVHGTLWRKGRHNYKVVYRAGYEEGSVPADLKLACLTWVAIIWNRVEHNSHNIQSESFGDKNTSYRFEKIPAEVEQMLSRYVRQAYA